MTLVFTFYRVNFFISAGGVSYLYAYGRVQRLYFPLYFFTYLPSTYLFKDIQKNIYCLSNYKTCRKNKPKQN